MRLYGFVLVVVGSIALIVLISTLHKQLEYKKKMQFANQAWRHYFQVDFRIPIESILPNLNKDQVVVAGIDVKLHDDLMRYNNRFYDSTYIDYKAELINVYISIPEWLMEEHIEEYGVYQAINYALIIDKLRPNSKFSRLNIKMMGEGSRSSEKYIFAFDFADLISVQGQSYSSIYNENKKSNKISPAKRVV